MAERFVSLATLVRASVPVPEAPTVAIAAVPATAATASTAAMRDAQVVRNVRDFAHADVVHELALLRLAAREAYERATVVLLETLARDVLARELALAPVDLAALVRDVLATADVSEPIALAVSPADAQRVHATLPVRVDAALAAGDLVVDVRDGAFVSTFALRLEDALARVAAAVRL